MDISHLGLPPELEPYLEAASFLAGAKFVPEPAAVRRAAWRHDGHPCDIAVEVYGLRPEDNEVVEALVGAKVCLKAEGEEPPHPALGAGRVRPLARGDEEIAKEVSEAMRTLDIIPLKLKGKHTQGMALAGTRGEGRRWMLKPGLGGVSPAAGVPDSPGTSSAREAAFPALAQALGLGLWVPRTAWLEIDGAQWAAQEIVPWDYEQAKDLDPITTLGVFGGRALLTWQWAVLDYVGGNPDCHGGNILVHPETHDVRLIDHGSSFAGPGFDPGQDESSFVPYYLRYRCQENFQALSAEEKVRHLQALGQNDDKDLRTWIQSLNAWPVENALAGRGLDAKSCVQRLERVKASVAAETEAWRAVARLWVGER